MRGVAATGAQEREQAARRARSVGATVKRMFGRSDNPPANRPRVFWPSFSITSARVLRRFAGVARMAAGPGKLRKSPEGMYSGRKSVAPQADALRLRRREQRQRQRVA